MMADDLTECPFYLITRASLAVTSRLKQALAAAGAVGVRPSYLVVLMTLWKEDGLKVIELGRRAGLEPSTMTGLVDRMQRDGFVTRSPDPDDRRAYRIHLTEQGQKVQPAAESAVDESLATVLDGIASEDLDHLKDALRRVLTNANRGVSA